MGIPATRHLEYIISRGGGGYMKPYKKVREIYFVTLATMRESDVKKRFGNFRETFSLSGIYKICSKLK